MKKFGIISVTKMQLKLSRYHFQLSKEVFDESYIIYNSFKNVIQKLTNEKFLPVEPIEESTDAKTVDYIFEPNQEEILNELIPNSLKIKFYKALLDSFASEHGARMTAMHKATDNATEMKKELTLFYNKARQASITSEILKLLLELRLLAVNR